MSVVVCVALCSNATVICCLYSVNISSDTAVLIVACVVCSVVYSYCSRLAAVSWVVGQGFVLPMQWWLRTVY